MKRKLSVRKRSGAKTKGGTNVKVEVYNSESTRRDTKVRNIVIEPDMKVSDLQKKLTDT